MSKSRALPYPGRWSKTFLAKDSYDKSYFLLRFHQVWWARSRFQFYYHVWTVDCFLCAAILLNLVLEVCIDDSFSDRGKLAPPIVSTYSGLFTQKPLNMEGYNKSLNYRMLTFFSEDPTYCWVSSWKENLQLCRSTVFSFLIDVSLLLLFDVARLSIEFHL